MKKEFKYVLNLLEKELPKMCKKWKIVGSILRGSEDPRDVDVLIIPNKRFSLDRFPIDVILANGEIKKRVMIKGVQVDFVITNHNSWGTALAYFTGSKWFNIKMRAKAKSMGMKLNEHRLMSDKVAYGFTSERELFKKLKMQYVKPELRN